MNRDALTGLSKDELVDIVLAQARQIEMLMARVAELTARVAELEARLGLPPKTPDNSSTPPSQGHKASVDSQARPKAKAHPGAHRPLHPKPTRREEVRATHCPHCRADVTGVAQVAVEAYDRIELPEIAPDITRVVLHGGVCPC